MPIPDPGLICPASTAINNQYYGGYRLSSDTVCMPAGPVTIYDFELNPSILLLPDIYESLSSCKGHYDQSHLTRQDTFDVTDKTGSIRKISIHIGFPLHFPLLHNSIIYM